MTELPREVGDREYQSYTRDPLGNVARSVFGGVYVTDQDGDLVDVVARDQIKSLSVDNHRSLQILEEIKRELITLNKKIDLFFC
jgi:hypothetical protein